MAGQRSCANRIYEHIYMNYRDTQYFISLPLRIQLVSYRKFHQCIYVWIFKNLRFQLWDLNLSNIGALTSQGFHRVRNKRYHILFTESYFSFL